MKKLMFAAMMMIGMTSFAQKTAQRGHDVLTSEQRTERQVKKMASELELNDVQQKQLAAVIRKQQNLQEAAKAKRVEAKKTGNKPTSDERLAMKKEMLDHKIALRQDIKQILTPAQFEKWEQFQEQRKEKAKSRMGDNRREKGKEISK